MRRRAVSLACSLALALSGGAAASAEKVEQARLRIGVNVYGYILPDDPDFLMLTAPIDVGRWHVEGRYNYEALRSGSLFLGANVGLGTTLKLNITPMLGGVFGALDGLAPALRLTMAWWKLDLYTESETVIDFHDASDSFFYAWSELGFSAAPWTRLGATLQRSLVFETSLQVQRGVFASVTIRFLTLSLYEFNWPWNAPTWVVAASAAF